MKTGPAQRRRELIVARGTRLPLLALGILSLACGIWGGLLRLPWMLPLPADGANWITFHGALMVSGFLGTVITLERAVGLGKPWTYAAPLLTGTGALLLACGGLGRPPLVLITLGSVMFLLVTLRIVQLQRALFTSVMAGAAAAWLGGNALWLSGFAVNRVVPWWIAFLGLTIVGERLDLSRFRKPSRWSIPLLIPSLALTGVGVVLSAFEPTSGQRCMGAGLLALGLWLAQFDLARRTVRQPGLSRYMALCLLIGYGWLALAGVLLTCFAPLESGFHYDAVLHSFFLGFIFSMIFGHAPIIFPAVLQLRPSFRRTFYSHLLLLHLGLVLRVGADLANWPEGHRWGGMVNAIAVAVFLINTVSGFLFPSHPATPPSS